MIAADELVRQVHAAGADMRLGGPTGVEVVRYRRLDAETIEAIRANRLELRDFLERKATLAPHIFTTRGNLCSRCRGIGRTAVVGGDWVCTFCVVAEAQRLALKDPGT